MRRASGTPSSRAAGMPTRSHSASPARSSMPRGRPGSTAACTSGAATGGTTAPSSRVGAIQVLHHGDREQSHRLLADTVARVAPGGMLAIGIETVGTDVAEHHEVLERADDGSYTIRYLESSGELVTYFRTVRGVHVELPAAGLVPETLLQPRSAWRTPPDRGQTLELEGIYRRP